MKGLLNTILFVLLSSTATMAQTDPGFLTQFPNTLNFEYDKRIEIIDAGVSVAFEFQKGGSANVICTNQMETEIKPNITIWVFNQYGLVLHKHKEVWNFSSLAPDKPYTNSWKYDFQIEDDLLFFVDARNKWDLKPAYILVVGSSHNYDRLIDQARNSLKKSITPRKSSPTYQAAPTNNKWYEGGTLHKGKIGDWRNAQTANKLATCADFVALTAKRQGRTISLPMMRIEAENLMKCIDTAISGNKVDHLEIAEIAASCLILIHNK